jgi:hypothetical protein
VSLSTATVSLGTLARIPLLGLCRTWRSSPSWNGIWDAWHWPPRSRRTCSTSTWTGALDELIGLYLTDTSPDEYALGQEDVWLEIRGLRGELQMDRLTGEEFARRVAAQPIGTRS